MARKKVHCLTHVPFEGPGYIADWAKKSNYEFSQAAVYGNEKYPHPTGIDLLVIMGGPMSVNEENKFPWLALEKEFVYNCIQSDIPILGICLGAQMLADVLGAPVYHNPEKEIGWFEITQRDEAADSSLGRVLPRRFTAFHWHGETFDIPDGAVPLAKSAACCNQAFSYNNDRVLALQFHCESTEESVQDLVENCRDELDGSKWVMNEHAIMEGVKDIPYMHSVADRLLDILTG
ncbi:MAG: type 1 glutamine amidotransferase [Spirochaetota bacterium]